MTAGHLLDTSVISMFAPGRRDATLGLSTWINANESRLHLSSSTIFEIEQGASKLQRAGGAVRAALYREWMSKVVDRFGRRVLPLDAETAALAGALSDAAWASGKHPGLLDIFVGATAKAHGLTLLTRNVKHFEPLEIAVLDPLVTLPR